MATTTEPDGYLAERMAGVRPSAIRRMLEVSTRPGMISFAGGLPAADLFDIDGLSVAFEAVMSECPRTALQYGATVGPPSLREALSGIMADRGATADPGRIVVTTGAQQALDLLCRIVLDPGDAVFVERPTYATALQTFHLSQADVRGVTSDDGGLDVEHLGHAIADARRAGRTPKLVYVIPTFSNPAGWMTDLARRRALVELAARHRVLIVEDDPYGEIHFDAAPPPSVFALAQDHPEARNRVAYLGSLSKVVSPGLRIGWAVLPPALTAPFTIAKQACDLQSSTVNQAVAQRYLAGGALARHLPILRQNYRARCATLCAALETHLGPDGATFQAPRGGLFVWLRLRADIDADALVEQAIDEGVVYVPGRSFFATAPEANTLRLTFATVGPEAIETGTRRLAAVIGRQRSNRRERMNA